jgi:hypothetical protein
MDRTWVNNSQWCSKYKLDFYKYRYQYDCYLKKTCFSLLNINSNMIATIIRIAISV